MPELPEVETLCRQLRQVIVDRRIRDFRVIDDKLGVFPSLIDRRITTVQRLGKGMEFLLDSGLSLFLHLRMSGKLLWRPDYPLPLSHVRLVVQFETGWLLLIDPRRFATLSYRTANPDVESVELPLAAVDLAAIQDIAKKRRIPVKAFLLDQHVMAGIGNIYACEILHAASIAPERPACDLSAAEWRRVAKASSSILKRAIRCRGTTISDWHDLYGKKGENQHHLKIYGRAGEACMRCGAEVIRKRIGGRGTYACPACQK